MSFLMSEVEIRGAAEGAGWAWKGREAKLLRGMLRALFGHCITHIPDGWVSLEHAAFRLR